MEAWIPRGENNIATTRTLDSAQKKFSPGHDSRGPTQKNFAAFDTNGLRSALGMHFDRGLRALRCNCRHSRGTRSRAGGKCFPGTALEETHSHVVLPLRCNQFDVHSFWKLRTALNFGGTSLPVRGELRHKNDV